MDHESGAGGDVCGAADVLVWAVGWSGAQIGAVVSSAIAKASEGLQQAGLGLEWQVKW